MSISTLKKSFAKKFPTSGAWKEFRYGASLAAKLIEKKIHNRIVVFSALEVDAINNDAKVIYESILAVLHDLEDAAKGLMSRQVGE